MLQRRAALSLIAGLTLLPLAAAADDADCGCGGPKSDKTGRAETLYRQALAEEDLARRLRLLELASRLDPDHPGVQAALADTR